MSTKKVDIKVDIKYIINFALNLKVLWIRIEILTDKNLSDKEKHICSFVIFLCIESDTSEGPKSKLKKATMMVFASSLLTDQSILF